MSPAIDLKLEKSRGGEYDRVQTTDVETGNGVFGKFTSIVNDFSVKYLDTQHYPQQQHRGDGDVGAGHVGRYISLANPDRVSQFMCHVPSILTFGTLGVTVLLALVWTPGAFLIITLLSINQFFWG